MIDSERVRALVARELALIADPARREALHGLLVEPRVEEREWDYGEPGERYAFWVVAESRERGIILVYCEQGFGPKMPWGFLFTERPESSSLGMEDQWGWYLEEVFVQSGLWGGAVGREEAFDLPPEERFLQHPAEGA